MQGLAPEGALCLRPDTRRYEWDAEDRIVGMTTPDGARWRYRYCPLGAARRDAQTSGRQEVVHGEQPVQEGSERGGGLSASAWTLLNSAMRMTAVPASVAESSPPRCMKPYDCPGSVIGQSV
ncbi:RHS repeat domain-containing protein [Streptomyces collinus]